MGLKFVVWERVKMMISVFDRVGNILGKGENAGNQNVPKMFSKASSMSLKVGIVWERVKDHSFNYTII